METGLNGRTVFITDVGNALGITSALAFVREGANLMLSSRDRAESLRDAERSVLAAGGRTVAGPYDAGSEDAVRRFVNQGLEQFGRIDVLVNNLSGARGRQSLAAMSFEEWRRALHLELTASLFVCRAVLPAMVERHWGRLIQYIGLPGFVGADPATSAAHMGVVGLTRGVATQYGKNGITANCIGTGGVEGVDDGPEAYPPSKLNDPLGRAGTAQEVASAAVYLASESAGYITGQCYMVNGGKLFL